MSTDQTLPKQFEAVLDSNEKILWLGQPAKVPFMLSGIPFLTIGLIWGAFDSIFILQASKDMPSGALIAFFTLHLFPTWGSILNFVRLYLIHPNTFYAVTDKRLLMRSGFWGTDFKAIDYDRIQDLEVNVGPIENMFNVGSVMAFSGSMTRKGSRVYDYFRAIKDPYAVFKQIKQVSLDVKSDLNYPNKLRPDENPGYNTEYKRKSDS